MPVPVQSRWEALPPTFMFAPALLPPLQVGWSDLVSESLRLLAPDLPLALAVPLAVHRVVAFDILEYRYTSLPKGRVAGRAGGRRLGR